ncbi:MAG: transglycosylase SLT domain-containing protein, partial [Campylobacterales bacterium]
KPSHVRDFAILRAMEANLTLSQSLDLFMLTTRPKPAHLDALATKEQNGSIKRMVACSRSKLSDFDQLDDECLELAFSTVAAMNLSNEQLLQIAERLAPLSPEKAIALRLITDENLSSLAWQLGARRWIELFLAAGGTPRLEQFDVNLTHDQLDALTKTPNIDAFLKAVAIRSGLGNLKRSLAGFKAEELSADHNFWIFLSLLQVQLREEATLYLNASLLKAKTALQRDRARFWRWILNHDNNDLIELIKSSDLNFYTLYAYEELAQRPSIETEAIGFTTDSNSSAPSYTEPFGWWSFIHFVQHASEVELFELAKRYNTTELEHYRAYILERAWNFRRHYYISPFQELLTNETTHRKAIVLAIGRQESRFLEGSLSRSYAVGVMQLMPFVIDAIAKQKKEQVALEEFFKAEPNIRYALIHLNWLEEQTNHPLLTAYAYNGGFGALKRGIANGLFADLSQPYEPFLSMERIASDETRDYGKKVLVNYVIYRLILSDESNETEPLPTLHSLLQSLDSPLQMIRAKMRAQASR